MPRDYKSFENKVQVGKEEKQFRRKRRNNSGGGKKEEIKLGPLVQTSLLNWQHKVRVVFAAHDFLFVC